MIKLEVGNVPSYTRTPKELQHNYEFLPDGYQNTLVIVETLEEILADKLISLVNCQSYIRHRDIRDLKWLKQKVNINLEFIHKKLADYQVDDYTSKVDNMIQRLPEIIHSKSFKEEMLRFIPTGTQKRTLEKDKFYAFLEYEITGLLKSVSLSL